MESENKLKVGSMYYIMNTINGRPDTEMVYCLANSQRENRAIFFRPNCIYNNEQFVEFEYTKETTSVSTMLTCSNGIYSKDLSIFNMTTLDSLIYQISNYCESPMINSINVFKARLLVNNYCLLNDITYNTIEWNDLVDEIINEIPNILHDFDDAETFDIWLGEDIAN